MSICHLFQEDFEIWDNVDQCGYNGGKPQTDRLYGGHCRWLGTPHGGMSQYICKKDPKAFGRAIEGNTRWRAEHKITIILRYLKSILSLKVDVPSLRLQHWAGSCLHVFVAGYRERKVRCTTLLSGPWSGSGEIPSA